jgi:acyl-CoA oxidase
MQGATTIAVRYSAHRQQFGPDQQSPEVAVLDYPSQQLKLMPMLATAYALHFTRDVLISKYTEMKRNHDDNDVLVADVHSLSAGLKAYTTSYTNSALSVARECCGGHGYAAVNRLGALRSDHDIFQTFEGDNTVLLQQVAALLLKQYKDSFSQSSIVATFSYLKQMMQDALPTNPLVSHATEPSHLRNGGFLKKALRYRTARLLHSLAARLRKHTARNKRKYGDSAAGFHAWNTCLLHVLALSRAHIESVMLDAFLNAVDTCPDVECRKSLKAMADLFALERIHADVLFRNDDYVAPEKEKAIRKMIEHLCAELRGVALPLVDSFGIPDHILRAPIGLSSMGGFDPYGEYLSSVGFGQ